MLLRDKNIPGGDRGRQTYRPAFPENTEVAVFLKTRAALSK